MAVALGQDGRLITGTGHGLAVPLGLANHLACAPLLSLPPCRSSDRRTVQPPLHTDQESSGWQRPLSWAPSSRLNPPNLQPRVSPSLLNLRITRKGFLKIGRQAPPSESLPSVVHNGEHLKLFAPVSPGHGQLREALA